MPRGATYKRLEKLGKRGKVNGWTGGGRVVARVGQGVANGRKEENREIKCSESRRAAEIFIRALKTPTGVPFGFSWLPVARLKLCKAETGPLIRLRRVGVIVDLWRCREQVVL